MNILKIYLCNTHYTHIHIYIHLYACSRRSRWREDRKISAPLSCLLLLLLLLLADERMPSKLKFLLTGLKCDFGIEVRNREKWECLRHGTREICQEGTGQHTTTTIPADLLVLSHDFERIPSKFTTGLEFHTAHL